MAEGGKGPEVDVSTRDGEIGSSQDGATVVAQESPVAQQKKGGGLFGFLGGLIGRKNGASVQQVDAPMDLSSVQEPKIPSMPESNTPEIIPTATPHKAVTPTTIETVTEPTTTPDITTTPKPATPTSSTDESEQAA